MELERILVAERSVDALRYLKRGTSLLDSVVLIKQDDGPNFFNGVRIAPKFVVTLRTAVSPAGTRVTVDGDVAEVAWSSVDDIMLLHTPLYEGALPDLSVASYEGSVALVYVNQVGEPRLAFGRAQADSGHDAPTEPPSFGAPLFDDAWRMIGLHQSRDNEGVRKYVPARTLVRQLEQSPFWTEIATVHRLARSAATESMRPKEKESFDAARAVRWSTDADAAPMSERERRRAIAGMTIVELQRVRGSDLATTPEQRAVDRILAGPPYRMDTLADEVLLPFATAARWFRDVIPALPDDDLLGREVSRRRHVGALVAIVGSRFAGRGEEMDRLRRWLADPDRAALVIRGPGGIGKSALLAHFILENAATIRFAWLDFDRPEISADGRSIGRAVDQQLAWQKHMGQLVVVLDSFETAVQTYGYANLNPALDALAVRFDDLAVVVGSRAPVPLLKVQGEPAQEWMLPGLPLEAVKEWLSHEGVPDALTDEVAIITNGVPLNMKLARELLRHKDEDEARHIVASLPKELATGYLYRRILRRLRDNKLKNEAQWSMVPRRLVPELLAVIMDLSKEDAEQRFAALRSELTLLEGDAVLSVRPDLRNTLLPLLESEDSQRVRKIDAISADFWEQRSSDETAAGDAVYHLLRIGEINRAKLLWRKELGRFLGGYTMEELPESSQVWLEARLSRERDDEATEALVASGDILEAAATLRTQPRAGTTLSARQRRRLINRFSAEANFQISSADANDSSLAAIVLKNARPAIRIRDGTFKDESAPWSPILEQERTSIEHAIACTGRIKLADGNILGTASLIGRDLFVTTRTVAERFAVGIGHAVQFVEDRKPTIDMNGEGKGEFGVHPITQIVLIHPYWDIAIVRAESLDILPLQIAATEPSEGVDIAVIGHPARNPLADDGVASIFFNDEFDVKRLMPGKYLGRRAELSFGRTVQAGLDDASAVGTDFGAAIIDVRSGDLVGVRFSSAFLDSGKFVPAWELARDPAIANAGVLVRGTPLSAPKWTSAWNDATPVRHTLLDAYVARASGDLQRARALLKVVSEDDAVVVDRTLLDAACALSTDRLRAANLLHELIERTPRDAWLSADRDALIATRLRLVVDAEAEREFLAILRDQPIAASLMEQRHFRVLVPPEGSLPWKRLTDGKSTDIGDESKFSHEAVTTAKRIVKASEDCFSLRGWIESNAGELANLNYLFTRSRSDTREIAAAFVAYPLEMVRPATDFLLEKTDIAPHPSDGWSPIIEPLSMLFRDAGRRPPDGVTNTTELEVWLDRNAKSGRLGSYLIELLRFDTQVSWQAGLLHLTTELPIESLLKRRFSGAVSA